MGEKQKISPIVIPTGRPTSPKSRPSPMRFGRASDSAKVEDDQESNPDERTESAEIEEEKSSDRKASAESPQKKKMSAKKSSR